MTHASYWTASDGTRLHYRYDDFTDPWKDAPLVVLLHPGLGSSLRLFGWVPHLARTYRVVRPDIRGHGNSEPGPDEALTHERLAFDLVELFDHFGVSSAHVMGSSAGGMIAGRAALRHPARFRSLAMYAATAGIPPSRPAKGNWLERVGRDGVRKFLEETAVDRIGQASPEHVRWYIESAAGVTPQFLARFVPLPGGASAMTLGHVVLGRDAAALERTRAHERVHVAQYERWGPLFIPAYLLVSAWLLARGRDPYADNPFERAAEAKPVS